MFAGIKIFILPQHVFKSFVPQLSASPELAPETWMKILDV
jgi:hypothetical protein